MTSVVQLDDESVADSVTPATTRVTQSKTQLTKTFCDTTQVKTRRVTTTSRQGHNKVVTKSTTTTTTRTKRAKIRLEPLDHGGSQDKRTGPPAIDVTNALENFVSTVENDKEHDDDDVISEDDVATRSESSKYSPKRLTGNSEYMITSGKIHDTIGLEAETMGEPEEGDLSRADDVMTTSELADVSCCEPTSFVSYRDKQRGEMPEGLSYKELYYDGVFRC